MSEPYAAREEVIRCALRVLQAEHGDESSPHAAADSELADDMLDRACKALAEATSAEALDVDNGDAAGAIVRRLHDSLGQFVTGSVDPGTEALAAMWEARQFMGRGGA